MYKDILGYYLKTEITWKRTWSIKWKLCSYWVERGIVLLKGSGTYLMGNHGDNWDISIAGLRNLLTKLPRPSLPRSPQP